MPWLSKSPQISDVKPTYSMVVHARDTPEGTEIR